MTKFLPACSKALEPLPGPKHAQIPRSYIPHNEWIFHSKYCLVRKLAWAPGWQATIGCFVWVLRGLVSPAAAGLASRNFSRAPAVV